MKITIVGNIFGSSGYANHTRGLANALKELGLDVSIRTQLFNGWQRHVNDNELEMINKQHNPKDSYCIYIGLPYSNPPLLSERWKKFIQFVVWEGDKIPYNWMENLLDKRVDMIFVPSNHTKTAILNTFSDSKINIPEKLIAEATINLKIRIVPHGVDKDVFYPEKTKIKDKFLFLANKGYRHNLDRGGVQYLIKAFGEEFTSKDNVELLLKINPCYGIPDFEKLFQELDIKNMDIPNIKICTDDLDKSKLRLLYNSANVFVSPTMSDAFNLPCVEAMACSIPVITTDFGGQIDFVNKDNGWLLIKGKMIEVTWELLYEGCRWKKCDIDELRKVLRYCYNHPEEVKNKGLTAFNDSIDWTWQKSAVKAFGFLKELEK